jgi:hypothetical protein
VKKVLITRITIIITFVIVAMFSIVEIASADGPTVSEGTVNGTEDLGGVRSRAFNRTSEKEIYLGGRNS